jgi:2-polyprenyl-3-methyl-5-hydroxy-6-metoxy-1,4-benzoquinol methylase
MGIALSPKPAGYYDLPREDVVAELPRPIGHALDVGCGSGAVGRSLRAAGALTVSGVELDPVAAEAARSHLDAVHRMPVEDAVAAGAITGRYNTICCYDVLEHLVDPESVVRALREVAAPGGRLHISIPNARHFSLLYDLAVRGTFGYTDFGHRDATHLRWFTRRDLVAMVAGAGWQVAWCRATFSGRDRIADRLTLGRAREFLTLQWHLLAAAG